MEALKGRIQHSAFLLRRNDSHAEGRPRLQRRTGPARRIPDAAGLAWARVIDFAQFHARRTHDVADGRNVGSVDFAPDKICPVNVEGWRHRHDVLRRMRGRRYGDVAAGVDVD
jgi:hypothetical protein